MRTKIIAIMKATKANAANKSQTGCQSNLVAAIILETTTAQTRPPMPSPEIVIDIAVPRFLMNQ